jgi:m7GpppX diphosphatase
VYEDEHFIITIDLKYNGGDLANLYCLAIPKNRSLKTVRDLTDEHLNMLKSIRDNGFKAVGEKFGIN